MWSSNWWHRNIFFLKEIINNIAAKKTKSQNVFWWCWKTHTYIYGMCSFTWKKNCCKNITNDLCVQTEVPKRKILIASDISIHLLPVFSDFCLQLKRQGKVENVAGAESKVPLYSWDSSTGMPPLTAESLEGKEKGERMVSSNCFIYQFKVVTFIQHIAINILKLIMSSSSKQIMKNFCCDHELFLTLVLYLDEQSHFPGKVAGRIGARKCEFFSYKRLGNFKRKETANYYDTQELKLGMPTTEFRKKF